MSKRSDPYVNLDPLLLSYKNNIFLNNNSILFTGSLYRESLRPSVSVQKAVQNSMNFYFSSGDVIALTDNYLRNQTKAF
jgi:hypothetical protein